MKSSVCFSAGTKSLKKMCLSVIVNCLKDCGLPDPDQLLDYVPTTVMQSIVNACRAHSHVVYAV